MPISTRPSNSQAHPGLILLEGQKTKRTSKQVKEDAARKKNAAITAQRHAETTRRAVLLQLAESEDAVERDEDDIRANTNRPDIRYEFLSASRLVLTYLLSYRTSAELGLGDSETEIDPR